MNTILVIVLIILVVVLYKAFQFANFKSQLMHALAQEGLTYNEANDLYTIHAKLAANMHSEGLSVQDIAKGISCVYLEDNDKDIIDTCRLLSIETGKLASEIRLKFSKQRNDILNITEFAILINAFVISLKSHYDALIEDPSIASRLLSVTEKCDYDAMGAIKNDVVETLLPLSDDDASGYMFYFFWPQLHGELIKNKSGRK